MIITKTPMRISFIGGGSDFLGYYKDDPGFVVAASLQKYVYINVMEKFDNDVRLSYSITEITNYVRQLSHDIARECLLNYGIQNKIEISSCSEIPSNGSGLGSSSSYAVGLINALNQYINNSPLSKEEIAKKACEIEIDILKKPIGKQDQYIASYGGIKSVQFNPSESVIVNDIASPKIYKHFEDNLLLVFTGITRKADSILKEQSDLVKNNSSTKSMIKDMVVLAKQLEKDIISNNPSTLGLLLDEAWNIKKNITKSISNSEIDYIYNTGKNSGASGGKLLGAGGGGFVLFYADKDAQKNIRHKLSDYIFIDVKLDRDGSKIIYNSYNRGDDCK